MSDDTLLPAHAGAAPPAKVHIERGDRQIRYMAQSVLLEESGTSRLVRMAILVVSLVVVAFAVWSALTRIDEVAAANGQVVPSGSVQVVQHLEGGIVRDILVRDKDLVDAGQSLIRFDPTQALAELDQVRARRMALWLRTERLRAFTEGREPDFGFALPDYRRLVEDQQSIYRQQLTTRDSQREVLERQIAQKEAQLATIRNQQTAVRQQLAYQDEELQMRSTLVDQGLTSKILLLNLKREYANTQGELARLTGQIATVQEELAEIETRLVDIDATLRQDALQELGEASAELAQVEKSLQRAEDRVRRLEVVAPARGYVQDLKVNTVGAVLPAGGVLMEIVPVDEILLVEAKISTRDVGHVSVGQPVAVKVTSYDFARYGSIDGTLQSVSATTFIDEQDGRPYYKATVELSQPYVGNTPGLNPVLPGMTVQADVVTGHKTLLQYLLKPIYVSLRQAFHER